jgi:hypothetical protein
MKIEILANGNLSMSLTDVVEKDILEYMKNKKTQEGMPDFSTEDEIYFLTNRMNKQGFDWVKPEEIGALTSAPCIIQENTQKVWAFMDYALRSILDDLLEEGEAIFQHG